MLGLRVKACCLFESQLGSQTQMHFKRKVGLFIIFVLLTSPLSVFMEYFCAKYCVVSYLPSYKYK